jgi:hypothetical protein
MRQPEIPNKKSHDLERKNAYTFSPRRAGISPTASVLERKKNKNKTF